MIICIYYTIIPATYVFGMLSVLHISYYIFEFPSRETPNPNYIRLELNHK